MTQWNTDSALLCWSSSLFCFPSSWSSVEACVWTDGLRKITHWETILQFWSTDRKRKNQNRKNNKKKEKRKKGKSKKLKLQRKERKGRNWGESLLAGCWLAIKPSGDAQLSSPCYDKPGERGWQVVHIKKKYCPFEPSTIDCLRDVSLRSSLFFPTYFMQEWWIGSLGISRYVQEKWFRGNRVTGEQGAHISPSFRHGSTQVSRVTALLCDRTLRRASRTCHSSGTGSWGELEWMWYAFLHLLFLLLLDFLFSSIMPSFLWQNIWREIDYLTCHLWRLKNAK